jgi:large subunit ribosomal protein L6
MMPISIPDQVEIQIKGSQVQVNGPKGNLQFSFHPNMQITQEGEQILINRPNDEPQMRAHHGLTRALINNMVVGVSEGFEKVLQIEGVGYRPELKGNALVLHVGFSHTVDVEPPEGISFEVDERARQIRIKGIDKQLVGHVAADIRKIKPPEPYKGKGIRYLGEYVRLKPGKAGKVE